jgi:hypothetical protein
MIGILLGGVLSDKGRVEFADAEKGGLGHE